MDCSAIYDNMPQLTYFNHQNIDCFKEEQYHKVMTRFLDYDGLNHLGLELLNFEITGSPAHLDDLVNVFLKHQASLNSVSLNRNKLTDAFIKDLCERISGAAPNLKVVDFLHLKEANNMNFVELLKNIAKLATNSFIKVRLSGYQTYLQQKEI